MKTSIKITAIIMLLTALAFAACGGGGSDSSEGGRTPAGTFTKEVALTESISSHGGMFANTDTFRHYQLLYKPAYIAGSGFIKSICFKYNVTGSLAVTCSNITIKLDHTNMEDLDSDMTQNIVNKGSAETVLNDATITIPAGTEGDYFEIPLSTEFNYNGVDNLVVDITRREATSPDYVGIPTGRGETNYTARVYSESSATPDTATSSSFHVFHTKFVFAGGDNKVDYNTTHNTSPIPFSTTPGYQKVQMLYNKDSIAGSGLITGIGLQVQTITTDAATYTYTMKLGHSTKTNLDTTWINNFDAGSPVTVADALQLRIPAGIPANEFIWLPIPDGVFSYNGTDNLVIELTIEAADGNVSLATHTTTNRNYMHGNPANNQATSRHGSAYQIALRFYGGQVTVLLPTLTEGYSIRVLRADQPGQNQKLYESYLLGTSGTITNVYVRLYDPAPAAASLTNYKLYMGHTVKTAYNIAETYASNMDENAIVFSGTLNIPAGLKQGDWVKIPLNSPFVYNSAKNLSILFTTDAGPSGNIVRAVFDNVLFNNHSVGRNDNSVTSSGTPDYISNNIIELALDIVK